MSPAFTFKDWERAKERLRLQREELVRRHQEELQAIDGQMLALENAEAVVTAVAGGANGTAANGTRPAKAGLGSGPPPTQKAMVLEAVRSLPKGADRAGMADFVWESYGVRLSLNAVTTYLGRLRDERLVRNSAEGWIPASSYAGNRRAN